MTTVTPEQHAGLSACWSARSFVLRKLGDHERSLEAARSACQAARDAARSTHTYDALLADRLDELARALDFMSERHEALAMRRESLMKRRSVLSGRNAADHHHHQLALARTLQGIAGQLSVQGDNEGALDATRDAIKAQRLGRAHDSEFPPIRDEQLAIYLAEHAQVLYRMDNIDKALDAISESVIILQAATDHLRANPPSYGSSEPLDELRQRLADQLLLQSMYAAQLKRWDEACKAGHTRVHLLQELAEMDSDGTRSRRFIIGSNTHVKLLLDAGRPAEAYDVGLATRSIIERMSDSGMNSAAFLDDVAETETILARSLQALKDADSQSKVTQ